MKTPIFILTIATLFASTSSLSEQYNEHYDEFYTSAKVIGVEPIYESVRYTEPKTHCHYEKRIVRHNRSSTPVIIGSLIGGAIGNELGHNKSNKRVGAVAGALLGGSIANDINRKNHHSHTTKERVCSTSHTVNYKKEITGYNVAYKYHGRTYHTTVDEAPGNRIDIAVSVRPLN